MTQRENVIACMKRKPIQSQLYAFQLCPSLIEEFKHRTGSEADYTDFFNFPWKETGCLKLRSVDEGIYKKYYKFELKKGTVIDEFGVAHEPGSEAAKHMTYMLNPMKDFDSFEQFQSYPYPEFYDGDNQIIVQQIKDIHTQQKAVVGNVTTTIWERAWYMRGMMELMVDMMNQKEWAAYHLDKITECAKKRAEFFVKNGVDVLYLGDDIGMQSTIMMSKELYREWIKPRLKSIIDSVRKINPDILIMYHSCGYVEPFIPDFIDIGIDILDPVQPECMNFEKLYKEFGDVLSFHGTIGTQTTMPFGSPEEVKAEVVKNLKITEKRGGLFCTPTHLLEPEVPWKNIMAYLDAVKNF